MVWRLVRVLLQILLAIALLAFGGLVLLYLSVEVPTANDAAAAQRNTYLYDDGTLLAVAGSVNRENVALSEVPLSVRHAVLAAEDRQFYHEGAVDVRAMLRGAYYTIRGAGPQSGSTITQQYVKNYYLYQTRTITRKIKEIIISVKVDRRLSKGKILEGYLNTSYFGRNAYGIQAAAQAYYGKDVSSLNIAEGAYLAVLLKAPSAYDLSAYPRNRNRVEKRWNYVLNGMVAEHWLTPAARRNLRFPQLRKAHPAAAVSGQRGYVVQAVEQYLLNNNIVSEQDLAAGGFTITTTIDRRRQAALAQAVSRQLLSRLSPGRKQDVWVRAAAASVDPLSGRTVALYGGADALRQHVNGATERDYQVASLFKPFVLAAALDNSSRTQSGEPITPNTVYDGTSRRPVQGLPYGSFYAPANEDDRNFGAITVETAMEQSVNSVFAQMAVDVGPQTVRSTALVLGLPPDVLPTDVGPSIALGTPQASVLDMSQAYATLDNHGARRLYTLVNGITKGGIAVALPQSVSNQVISRHAADTTTAMLNDVVDHGTAQAARALGRPAAAKTGTAEDDVAAWFAGYTPELVTVVAVQGQDPVTGALRPLYGAVGEQRVNGGDLPGRIWTDYTLAALATTPVTPFQLALPPPSQLPSSSSEE
ncbi:transglycosylase domain-containing protein [Streptomyces sp. NPDC001817]|uniref:transglycosylase domain-containing protein n=1 Tax=Streptomyces sp. NPDC001817 TaxID=3154398 RepID=UPI003330913C